MGDGAHFCPPTSRCGGYYTPTTPRPSYPSAFLTKGQQAPSQARTLSTSPHASAFILASALYHNLAPDARELVAAPSTTPSPVSLLLGPPTLSFSIL